MASRYHSKFKERKVGKGGARPAPGKTGDPGTETTGALSERTASWPVPGPQWGSSFNRATRVPVVKTRAKKGGID